MKSDEKQVDGWTACEYDVICTMLSGLRQRHAPVVLETHQAEDGSPVASFCCQATVECLYSMCRIDGLYIVSNWCGEVLEGDNLYRLLSQMLMPNGWVKAVQRVANR